MQLLHLAYQHFWSRFSSTLHCSLFIIFVTFCWMLSNIFMSVSLWSPEMGTVPSVSCLASPSAEQKGSITTLAGSTLQLRVPLCPEGHAAGSRSTWCPLRLPDTFPPSCFSDSCLHSLHVLVPGFVLSRTLQFPWLSFRMFPSAHFCSLLRSPQMTARPSVCQPVPPLLCR